MRFIEDMLGVAPDGGSGSLELLLMLAPIAIVLYGAHRLRMKRNAHRRHRR